MQTKSVFGTVAKKMVPAKKNGLKPNWFWAKWFMCLAVISVIFLISMDIAPYLHTDEFTIIDLGRIILHPNTNWSITWMTEMDQPVFVWFYLGPVLQEFAFQLGQYGPRI